MTPPARLAATIELLTLVDATPRPADATVSAFFRERRFIGSKDRAEISRAVYRAMRRHARLGWWLEQSGAEPTPRGLVLADLIVGEGYDPDRAERSFSGGHYAPAQFTPWERTLATRLGGHTLDHPGMPEAVAVECPPWAEAELRRALGDSFAREMGALIDPAPLDLRVNALKGERDAVLEQLRADGLNAEPTEFSPLGIRLLGRPPIMAHPLYRDGVIEIQDEGSQLVGLLVDARPGQQVIDFCAGAGGKTLAIAATMANKGRLFATDVLDGRLLRARERFRRAGVHNVQTRAFEGENDPWIKRHKGAFDRVLVDAPCGGSGTWRRNPDMRWRPLGPGLGELVPLQLRLLDSAARLVKPGGRLIYATCSLLTAENEDQAEAFVAAHPDFTLMPLPEVWGETIGRIGDTKAPSSPYLRLTPARHNTDGFFTAIFERRMQAMPDEAGSDGPIH
jgi:16S rRNA (cytosine967-C5)-methyltransferase